MAMFGSGERIQQNSRRNDLAEQFGGGLALEGLIVHAAEREQMKKSAPSAGNEAAIVMPADSKKGEELKAELDDLLDEIDEVLEENAEEFVRSYVQKGGE
jgi:ubiquitin-like protein Pup